MKDWLVKNAKTLKIAGAIFLLLAVFFAIEKNKKENKDIKKTGNLLNIETAEIKIENVPFDMPAINVPKFPNNSCNVENYGAIGDGKFINTEAIKKAIDDCFKKGGGKVIFPEGKWLTGPIHFKSNINIYIKKGAEIVFTTNFDDYLPVVLSKFQSMEYYNFSPPIYARDCENIALTGEGKIEGNGEFWAKWARMPEMELEREKLFKMSQENVPAEERIFGREDSGLRPSFIQFVNCKNILIEGITIGDGPMWTIHPIFSENIIIRNVNVKTHSMNTDGVAIDSSRNILIENSHFSTGDDSIVIKAGLEDEGIRVNRPSENIVVRNCDFSEGHGAVAIGSEMSGGVRNVFVKDCSFRGASSGFRIKSTRSRGGFIENIWVSDVVMNQIREEAVVFNLQYTSALKNKSASRVPILRNIHVNNMSGDCLGRAVDIVGQKDGIMENISFENINLAQGKKSELKYAKGISFRNISLKINDGPVLVIESSRDINLENLKCENNGEECLSVKGEKTSNVNIEKSGISKEKILIEDKAMGGVK